MKKTTKAICTLSLSLFLISCGSSVQQSNSSNDQGQNKIGSEDGYDVISDEKPEKTDDGTISGSGSMIFTESLGSTDAQRNFQLTATLDEDSSVTVHTFADKKLQNGIDFQFTRKSDQASIKVNGTPFDDKVSLDSSGQFSVSLDVHNNESPAHLIIESAGKELYNGTSGGWSNGGGKFWGLTLDEAEVIDARVDDAKHGHH